MEFFILLSIVNTEFYIFIQIIIQFILNLLASLILKRFWSIQWSLQVLWSFVSVSISLKVFIDQLMILTGLTPNVLNWNLYFQFFKTKLLLLTLLFPNMVFIFFVTSSQLQPSLYKYGRMKFWIKNVCLKSVEILVFCYSVIHFLLWYHFVSTVIVPSSICSDFSGLLLHWWALC